MNFLSVDLNTPSISPKAAHAVATPLLKPCCSIHKFTNCPKKQHLSISIKTVTNATFFTQHMNAHKRNISHMAHQQFEMQHFYQNTETVKNATL